MRKWNREFLYACSVFLLLAGVAGPVQAGEVKVGDKMPDFKMTDYNGKEHSLSAHLGKIVVVEFCSHKCPWSKGADTQWKDVAAKYADKGVVFLGIDSHSSTPAEELKAYASESGKPYPILKDENNIYADAVNAQRTPEVFVVNKEGKIVYHGAFDNRTKPEVAGDVNYVLAALDATLEGKPVEKTDVAAWGCTIKRIEKPAQPSE